ncbi:hypothetical protein [Streptomyces sp. NPDC088182]|uniref:hypothetical protein n=1 Tax=Streptomyces sp. NPDC088182 TaxID=3365838 RepID=UPI0038302DDA
MSGRRHVTNDTSAARCWSGRHSTGLVTSFIAIGVERLAEPGVLVEIEAVAVR